MKPKMRLNFIIEWQGTKIPYSVYEDWYQTHNTLDQQSMFFYASDDISTSGLIW